MAQSKISTPEGERGARVFTPWLNSLGVEPGVFKLFEDLKDGLIILQAFNPRLGRLAMRLQVQGGRRGSLWTVGKSRRTIGSGRIRARSSGSSRSRTRIMRLSSGSRTGCRIQGADIVDGTQTLVFGLVWEPMRFLPSFPSRCCRGTQRRWLGRMSIRVTNTPMGFSGSGRPIADQEMFGPKSETDRARDPVVQEPIPDQRHLYPRPPPRAPSGDRRSGTRHTCAGERGL
ncbi:hypothetical protein V8E55_007132 [Tylopilus felleus]